MNTTLWDNYDRKEEWNDTQTRDLETTGSVQNNGKDTTTSSVAGFNSDTLHDQTQTENSLGSGAESSGTDTGTVINVREGRAHGNIGVMSTQELIERQRDVVKFNIYDYIIDSFKKDSVC